MGYEINYYSRHVSFPSDDTGILYRNYESCGQRRGHREELILGDRVLRCMGCGERREP